jgi:hypothetical protein
MVDNLRLIMERRLVDQNSDSWNQVFSWLPRVDQLRQPCLTTYRSADLACRSRGEQLELPISNPSTNTIPAAV